MQPLMLTLKGFRGIRDGLGRDTVTLDFGRLVDGAALIALAGQNGRGKTTILDNMHPYLTLPSRAALAGQGAFSYYDHVVLPVSEKDLTWAHEGRSYRSQVVIRLENRRTEAFLFLLNEQGRWVPMCLDDGTVSDGKVSTYNRCLKALCGSEETFFTSAFSAQGRRPLSAYRNAEIKTLLADLLGQERLQAVGRQASEVAKLLNAGLTEARHGLAGLEEDAAGLAADVQQLGDAAPRAEQSAVARQAAHAELDEAKSRFAQLSAQREQSQGTEIRRRQLDDEHDAGMQAHRRAIAALDMQDQNELQRLERLRQRIAQRARQAGERLDALERQRRQCQAVLVLEAAVLRAGRRLPVAERTMAAWQERSRHQTERAKQLADRQRTRSSLEQKLASIEREAGQAALQAEDLARRLGLTSTVPCAGLAMQGQCNLLGDARQAGALIPSAQATIQRLAAEKSNANEELKRLDADIGSLDDSERLLRRCEQRHTRACDRASRYAVQAARAGEMDHARSMLCAIEQELDAMRTQGTVPSMSELEDAIVRETSEEQAERLQILCAREAIVQQRVQQLGAEQTAMARFQEAIGALPAAWDNEQWLAARTAVEEKTKVVAAAELAHQVGVRDVERLQVLAEQGASIERRRIEAVGRIERVQEEISRWTLLAKCMGPDGLIALMIDDAGPTLSGLANDLLLACYGPRFTVSIHTLLEAKKGEQKEGFAIVVHDGESGKSKDVQLMSGGERVWINECLTRAVALYLANHAGRSYTTLFSDEADGPLDVDRKRMFIAMKREVLRLGGYEREFFISQTPELTALADAVIDLDAMQVDVATESLMD